MRAGGDVATRCLGVETGEEAGSGGAGGGGSEEGKAFVADGEASNFHLASDSCMGQVGFALSELRPRCDPAEVERQNFGISRVAVTTSVYARRDIHVAACANWTGDSIHVTNHKEQLDRPTILLGATATHTANKPTPPGACLLHLHHLRLRRQCLAQLEVRSNR